jgi:hypothetical protein
MIHTPTCNLTLTTSFFEFHDPEDDAKSYVCKQTMAIFDDLYPLLGTRIWCPQIIAHLGLLLWLTGDNDNKFQRAGMFELSVVQMSYKSFHPAGFGCAYMGRGFTWMRKVEDWLQAMSKTLLLFEGYFEGLEEQLLRDATRQNFNKYQIFNFPSVILTLINREDDKNKIYWSTSRIRQWNYSTSRLI